MLLVKKSYTPEFHFVLADKQTGQFPKIDPSLTSQKLLTSSLEETYIFDDRDSQEFKVNYYNAVYKGIAEFHAFVF